MDVYDRMLHGNESLGEIDKEEKPILQAMIHDEKEKEGLNLLVLYEVYSIDDRLGSILVERIADLVN
jgi:hypothetical protein